MSVDQTPVTIVIIISLLFILVQVVLFSVWHGIQLPAGWQLYSKVMKFYLFTKNKASKQLAQIGPEQGGLHFNLTQAGRLGWPVFQLSIVRSLKLTTVELGHELDG